MMRKKSDYTPIVVESLWGKDSMGRSKIVVRPIHGQAFDSSLNVECSKSLIDAYPLGTRFRIKAKLTDMEGAPFVYSYFGWQHEVIKKK